MAKRYHKERDLKKIRPFIDDTGLIKAVTGIRRCGKSCLMETVADELRERGVDGGHIAYLDLEKRGLRSVRTSDQLEAAIESRLPNGGEDIMYLFIDEAQRVEGYEEVVNAYRADGSFSVFITGPNPLSALRRAHDQPHRAQRGGGALHALLRRVPWDESD